jgi:hypothetical protein
MRRLPRTGAQQLAAIADETAQRERQKQWHWCRWWNGFCNLPIWRRAAARLGMPPYQVMAFGALLEELANNAGNTGYMRGEVAQFSAEEFGVALGMPEADAARIFATLEELGWIADGFVRSFNDRNRDSDRDEGSANRKRKERGRDAVRKLLVELARLGLVTAEVRAGIEVRLYDRSIDELHNLGAELQRAKLSTVPYVTRDGRRDTVTVTPEESTGFKPEPVDNSGDATRAAKEGPSEDGDRGEGGDPQAAALVWLLGKEEERHLHRSEAIKVVTQRMDETATLAATRIERWLHQRMGGNAVALREIIEAVRASDLVTARFLQLIGDSIQRWKQKPQPQLALLPPRPKKAGHG